MSNRINGSILSELFEECGQKQCKVDGCIRNIRTMGFCGPHYQAERRKRPNQPKCRIDGCSRNDNGGGICVGHYNRIRKGTPLDTPLVTRPPKGTLCASDGCERKLRRGIYCDTHYHRARKGKPLSDPIRQGHSLESLHTLSAKRGGVCLSTQYGTISDTYDWQCAEGHIWSATFTSIFHMNSWCPECVAGRGERTSRYVLELMFEAKFPKSHPLWLRVPNAPRGLELDGYNDALNIAFEYQGRQHYEQGGRFSHEDVESIKKRDAVKRQECWKRMVILIQIPEFSNIGNVESVINQIEFAVMQAGLIIPRSWKKNRPSLIPATWVVTPTPVPDEMHIKAASIGWTCVSESYSSNRISMQWLCVRGHVKTLPWVTMRIKKDGWCSDCRDEDIMKSAKAVAIERGGECISNKFWTNGQPEWKCHKGHTWFADLRAVQTRGSWCQKCYHESRRLKAA